MARGIRTNPTLLPAVSQGVQPQSLASYDPLTRRNTILVANIVPTINSGESGVSSYIPSDRYYAQLGAMSAASASPVWFSASSSNVTYQIWDASRKAFYSRLSNAAGIAWMGQGVGAKVLFPSGPFGKATGYAPKNASPSAVWIRFTARFNANADYGDLGGIGAINSTNRFNAATDHFIQVLRNAGTWELGTCDGTTISQDAGGTADGGFHEFGVLWKDGGDIRLYVDGVLTITKTTNLPSQPLAATIHSENNTNTIDIVDYLVEWELG